MRVMAVCLLLVFVAVGLVWLSEQPAGLPVTGTFVDTPRPEDLERVESYARNAEATAQAARLQATRAAFESAIQRTESAAQITRQAEATATVQAWVMLGWAVTAGADRATAEAYRTAEAWQYTQTAVSSSARATEMAAGYLERTLQREEQRQEMTNTLLAIGPYLVIGIALAAIAAAALVAVLRYLRQPHVIQRDARGDAPLLVTPYGHYYDSDRSPAPLVQMTASGVSAPTLATAEATAQAVQRDQITDLYTRGLPGQPTARLPRPNQPALEPPGGGSPNFRIYGAGETPAPLAHDPELLPILDGIWREEQI